MNQSIVPQLVCKDLSLMRGMILIFAGVILASIAIVGALVGRVPDWLLVNFGFTFLMGPAVACGIVLVIMTVVMEKEKSTQPFILSLPATVREFTRAKLWVNVPVFTLFWLVASGAAIYFAFGHALLPMGALPLVTMIFLGVFIANIGILATGLLSQSMGWTKLSIPVLEMGTSAYLWTIAYLDPINRHISGPVAVWDATSIGIVAGQGAVAVIVLLMTISVQTTRRDFI